MENNRQNENLKALGKTTEYRTTYAPEVLETFMNKHCENDYWVRFNCPEFTSLCPITGQPDFAEIRINYIPDKKMVESKSLKLYLFSFRNHPSFHEEVVNTVLHTPDLQGVVIETYGSGNAPTDEWFISALDDAIRRGIIVLNVTQCKAGSVKMRQYAASCDMDRIGVIGAGDITIEAAIAKMMCLLGEYPNDKEHVKIRLSQSLRGEITEQ